VQLGNLRKDSTNRPHLVDVGLQEKLAPEACGIIPGLPSGPRLALGPLGSSNYVSTSSQPAATAAGGPSRVETSSIPFAMGPLRSLNYDVSTRIQPAAAAAEPCRADAGFNMAEPV
jgi:hypothetical protein